MSAGRLISDAWLRLLAAAHSSRGPRWVRALAELGDARSLLACNQATLLRAGLHRAEIECLRDPGPVPARWIAWLAEPDHTVVPFGAAAYPQRLAEIPDPPLALWVAGCPVAALDAPQVAVVGSRGPTRNGILVAQSLGAALSEAGIGVTSGLARGIDAASHRGALEGAGGTIAVLGSGIDRIYPRENAGLADGIRRRGLIVSEYPPGTGVRSYQFPERNRIIAGLSLGTLVVEATRRSGSLITARLAAEYGREVFAVPGSIFSPLSKGCHRLLRDGARLVEESGDIIAELELLLGAELAAEPGEATASGASPKAQSLPPELANCLDFSPISFDSLVTASGLTAAELSSMLLHLEIQGKIEALPGGRYCRLAKRA